VRSAAGVYVVEFEADWCAPCHAYAPVIEEIARERAGRAGFGRVDITAEPGLAQRCGIATVPSVVVFRSGEIVKRIFGARTKRYLRSELDLLEAREGGAEP
jgi:thioredoxin 1